MALKATATARVRQLILSSLDMRDFHLVMREPNKFNIKYHVHPQDGIENMLLPIANALCVNGVHTERTIIFCRTYLDTSEIFKLLVCMLGRRNALYASHIPPDTERSRHRLCEKLDGSTSSENQEHIVKSFTNPDGVVRVVVATIAFGMGLDSPNVRSVIHWGSPQDVDMYVQETGRGGRDGTLCNATLYYNKRTSCSTMMKEYYMNSTKCRREMLMSAFTENPSDTIAKPSPLHACCDINFVRSLVTALNARLQLTYHQNYRQKLFSLNYWKIPSFPLHHQI